MLFNLNSSYLHEWKLLRFWSTFPFPKILFESLEQVMEYSGQSSSAGGQFVGDRLKGPSLPASNDAAGERQDLVNIKESGVITHRDPQSWRQGFLRWAN